MILLLFPAVLVEGVLSDLGDVVFGLSVFFGCLSRSVLVLVDGGGFVFWF